MCALKIRWIGQSGYILSDENTTVCIDPYLSDVVNRVANRPRMVEAPFLPEELKCNAVVCTHNHLDHVDIDAIELMNKDDMAFLAPEDARETLLSCGVHKFVPFDVGAKVTMGDFELEAVFADHSIPSVGVIVRNSGYTMYFSGDTEYNEKLEEIKAFNIDIMFICINGKLGNMNVSDAVKLTRKIKPTVGIPTHYGMFESNTENPFNYTDKIDCGFVMEYNKEYDVEEVLLSV